jgi:hypothetical protein
MVNSLLSRLPFHTRWRSACGLPPAASLGCRLARPSSYQANRVHEAGDPVPGDERLCGLDEHLSHAVDDV